MGKKWSLPYSIPAVDVAIYEHVKSTQKDSALDNVLKTTGHVLNLKSLDKKDVKVQR